MLFDIICLSFTDISMGFYYAFPSMQLHINIFSFKPPSAKEVHNPYCDLFKTLFHQMKTICLAAWPTDYGNSWAVRMSILPPSTTQRRQIRQSSFGAVWSCQGQMLMIKWAAVLLQNLEYKLNPYGRCKISYILLLFPFSCSILPRHWASVYIFDPFSRISLNDFSSFVSYIFWSLVLIVYPSWYRICHEALLFTIALTQILIYRLSKQQPS